MRMKFYICLWSTSLRVHHKLLWSAWESNKRSLHYLKKKTLNHLIAYSHNISLIFGPSITYEGIRVKCKASEPSRAPCSRCVKSGTNSEGRVRCLAHRATDSQSKCCLLMSCFYRLNWKSSRHFLQCSNSK